MLVHAGSRWFMLVHAGSCWFTLVYANDGWLVALAVSSIHVINNPRHGDVYHVVAMTGAGVGLLLSA